MHEIEEWNLSHTFINFAKMFKIMKKIINFYLLYWYIIKGKLIYNKKKTIKNIKFEICQAFAQLKSNLKESYYKNHL